MSGTAVIVFAKAPVPGQVKTRLISAVGAAGAALVHEVLVQATLEAVAATAMAVELHTGGPADHPFFLACRRRFGCTLRRQVDGDLGRRMHHALASALAEKRQALLIGTDCPAMAAEDLAAADARLAEGADLVFVPTEDGGYALIGAQRVDGSLFAGLPWGSDAVMAATRARLRRLGWQWSELPTRWDVDRPEDLERLRRLGRPPFAHALATIAPDAADNAF
jgi:rSAM/selenodomain-associated transferase 1